MLLAPLPSHSNSPRPRSLQSCWRLSHTSPWWAAASPLWPRCSRSCCTSMTGIPLPSCWACPSTAAQHPSFFPTWAPRVRWAFPECRGWEAGDQPPCVWLLLGPCPSRPVSRSLCVYEPRGWRCLVTSRSRRATLPPTGSRVIPLHAST